MRWSPCLGSDLVVAVVTDEVVVTEEVVVTDEVVTLSRIGLKKVRIISHAKRPVIIIFSQ